jgi:hypothetical protein
MKRWIAVLMMLMLAGVAFAGDWKAGLMGNDRSLGIRAMNEVGPGIWIGAEAITLENANGIDRRSYTAAAIAAWDIIPEYLYPLKGAFLGVLPLPETVPIGLTAGASVGGELDVERRARAGQCDVWAELMVNPKSKGPFGVQFRHAFGPDAWKNLPTMPEADSVMLVLNRRF